MRRVVTLPAKSLRRWLDNPQGAALELPVVVDWPELQLTEHQMVAKCALRFAFPRLTPRVLAIGHRSILTENIA